MRVVELSTFHERCGIATYTEALVDALRDRGATTFVLAPRLPAGAKATGEQPARFWSRNRASLGEALATFREIRRLAPDVVHAQLTLGLFSPRFVLALASACRAARLPFVATLHERRGNDLPRRLRFRRLLFALRGVELVVHNTEHAAELGGRAVRVIPHGIRPPVAGQLALQKRALGLDPDLPVIAHFGFIHPDKGIEEVLRAVATLRRGACPGLTYLVCGGAFDSAESRAYLERLRRLARELGIADHVRIGGEFLDDARLIGELGAADWIVLNYRTGNAQGASGAVRHALVAGRPIAVSRAPVFDDVRGSVHSFERPLALELPRLLADSELAGRLVAEARVRAEAESWSRVAERHLELFEELRRRETS